MPTCFTIVLRNDDIQEFDSKCDGILLSMTKIPHDDILEGLYKLRIREFEKLKTVLELYNMEIHQKKARPDYHRLKTMVKRSIEQNLRMKNLEARNGNYERNAVVKNQGTKQRGQRILGDCWQREFNGQCSKGDNCSFRHDVNKRAKMTQPNPSPNSFMRQNDRNASTTRSPLGKSPSGRMSRWPCKDYLKGTCTNSFCEKWRPPECLFYKSESGCRFGEKCSYTHRQVEEQPSKRSKKNGDKSAVALLKKNEYHHRTGRPVVKVYSSNTRQLGCVFQDMEPPKSSSILRKSSDIRKPMRCVKFTKAVVRHADIRDQNPSLMMSEKDLNDSEMDTLTKSYSPTIIITANGEVQTHEEATVHVKELVKFLTKKVLENTPAVLSLGKLCGEHGNSYEWINGQKPHLMKNGIRIQCNTENFVPIVVPGLSASSSSSSHSSTSMTPSRQENDHPTSSSSSSTSPTTTVSSDSERDSRKGRTEWDRFLSSACVKLKC